MAVLRVAVPVTDPETGEAVVLLPGGPLPSWASTVVRNPRAWVQEPVSQPVPVAPPPGVEPPASHPEDEHAPGPEAEGSVEPDPEPVEDEQPDPEPETEPVADYMSLTKAQLLTLIGERNAAGESIPTDGNKADLIDALEVADTGQE